jgi:tetratricopeptide (TPR) repeat protein
MQSEQTFHFLKKARLKLGYTQVMLADFAQVGKATIQRAERGEPLRPDTIRQLCAFFSEYYHRQVEPQELGLVYWETGQSDEQNDSALSPQAEEEHNQESEAMMDRREAIKKLGHMGLILAAAPHVLLETTLTEQDAKTATIPELDEETWTHFEQLIETCWHLSKGNVLDIVEPTLWAYLPKLAAIATHSSKQQQIAAAITSQGYLLAAILAGHRDDLQERQSHCEQALSYGTVAKDRNLQVAALRQLALTFDYKDRPRKALQTYEQALPILSEVSPLLRARMFAGLAGSYAQFEREQDALRCISQAYESFPEQPEADPTFLYADCGYFTLVLWKGLMHLDLKQPKEAEKVFAHIDGLQPQVRIPERVRIEFLNYQAETFVALRDMERSSTYLEAAVKASLALRSRQEITVAR